MTQADELAQAHRVTQDAYAAWMQTNAEHHRASIAYAVATKAYLAAIKAEAEAVRRSPAPDAPRGIVGAQERQPKAPPH